MAKNLILWLVIAVVLMALFQNFQPGDSSGRQLDYTSFIKEVKQDQVREVRIDGKTIEGNRRNGDPFVTIIPVPDDQLIDDLLNHNVKVMGKKPEEPSLLAQIFISWFPMLLFIGLWFFVMRQMQGGGGKGAMSFGKSRARLMGEDQIKTTFADVAGCD